MAQKQRQKREYANKRTITAEDIYLSKNSNNNKADDIRTKIEKELTDQTPLNRRRRQIQTPKQPGTSRRRTQQIKYYVDDEKKIDERKKITHQEKKKRKERKSNFKRYFMTVLMMYIILMPITIGIFFLILPHHTTPETQKFTYQVGTDENIYSSRKYSWETVRFGKTYYADMTEIADYISLSTTGDSNVRKYIVRSTSENALFHIGQSSAQINGTEQLMDAPAKLIDNRLFVPASFIDRCFVGLTVDIDEENGKITVYRSTDEFGNEIPLSILYKTNEPTPPINYENIDGEIKQEILNSEKQKKAENN